MPAKWFTAAMKCSARTLNILSNCLFCLNSPADPWCLNLKIAHVLLHSLLFSLKNGAVETINSWMSRLLLTAAHAGWHLPQARSSFKMNVFRKKERKKKEILINLRYFLGLNRAKGVDYTFPRLLHLLLAGAI